ncbi:MAG: transposase [Anaerolineales bacterium]|nr:transposase [Anaerolineales bacterium]
MPTLPSDYLSVLCMFAPYFSNWVWQHAQVLLLGAILTIGQHTVTAALQIVGLSSERHFQTYHRVLNRAAWSSWALSRVLLGLLITTFAAVGDVITGLDDTIERRRGAKIKAKGIYRDPVRSSHSHFVKTSGLRWLSLMLLVPIPWAQRVWALPFLTVLAPSERYYAGRKRAHKKLTDWARQMLLQLRRWLPKRRLVVVADSSFAVISLLWRMTQLAEPLCLIVRFWLDAALYEPAPQRRPHQKGRPRLKGQRLPTLAQIAANPETLWQRVTLPDWYGAGRRTLEIASGTAVWRPSGQPAVPIRWVLIRAPKGKFKTQALLSTDLTVAPAQIVKWFVLRWQVEVTFHEVRAHLGGETQHQWSDKAILRTTPAFLALFSIVTLWAHRHVRNGRLPIRQAAWYVKSRPTFSDALAVVRQHLWQQ